ncbi:hypothetical protein M0813_15961 [Anaeramoeba flamelloides]|uniref:B box-type domain-containing protein n=1 Tax=Anaeramoeba flamelloides TaxID=1746091 RepID=A0ABQ8Z0S0_9EUKA|nr:hypothetical protein M0813_15961 [Anaeramoeba flamelloides]
MDFLQLIVDKYRAHECEKCKLDQEQDPEKPINYCKQCNAILCHTHTWEHCQTHITQVGPIHKASERFKGESLKQLNKTNTLIQRRKENVEQLQDLKKECQREKDTVLKQIAKLKKQCIKFVMEEIGNNKQCVNETQEQKIQQLISKIGFCDHNLKQLGLFQQLANETIECHKNKYYARTIQNFKSLQNSIELLKIDPPNIDEDPNFTVALNVDKIKTEISNLDFSSAFDLSKTTLQIEEAFGEGLENIKQHRLVLTLYEKESNSALSEKSVDIKVVLKDSMDAPKTFVSWTKMKNQDQQKYVSDYHLNPEEIMTFDSISVDVVTHHFDRYYLDPNNNNRNTYTSRVQESQQDIDWVTRIEKFVYKKGTHEILYRITNSDPQKHTKQGIRIGIIDSMEKHQNKTYTTNQKAVLFQTLWNENQSETLFFNQGMPESKGRPISKNSDLYLIIDMKKHSIICKDTSNNEYYPEFSPIANEVKVVIETLGDVQIEELLKKEL